MLRRVHCPGCGVSVATETLDDHVCDRDRYVAHQMAKLRPEIVAFDRELGRYLSTPRGRFEEWYAARSRDTSARVAG